jgi:adenosine deaminase
MYKKDQSKTEYLYTITDLNYLSKSYLKEYVKNHGKIRAEVVFAPYLRMGQTISVTDPYNNLSNVRYFIETVSHNANSTSLVLARYPGD